MASREGLYCNCLKTASSIKKQLERCGVFGRAFMAAMKLWKSPQGLWLALAAMALVAFVGWRSFRRPEPSVRLSSAMEAQVGMSSAQVSDLEDLAERFRTENLSEQDWVDVQKLVNGKSPLGISRGLSCFFRLRRPENIRRALNIVQELARRTPSDEPVNEMALSVVDFISSDGFRYQQPDGYRLVRSWSGGSIDPRLKNQADQSLAAVDEHNKNKGGAG